MQHRRIGSAGFVAAALATIVGCSPQNPTTTPPDSADPTIQSCARAAGPAPWQGVVRSTGAPVSIDAQDDYFKASCVVVPWNTSVRLVVTNRGHLPHTVTLPGVGLNTDLDAGQTVFVTLPATTTPLRFVCTYHVRQHMFGAIVPVRGDGRGVDETAATEPGR
jgi:plastocyanin